MLRPKKKNIARIETTWKGEKSSSFSLCNSHLEEYPLFKTFNKIFFNENLFPSQAIPSRNNTKKTISGSKIQQLIENLIEEVSEKKTSFKDFTVLRKSNFNTKKCSGLIILKCKNFPFVVKLFMETPETFVKYASKGLVPRFFFYLSGGANRHLLGFTRVKNLHEMKKQINNNPYWSKQVTFPRKWFHLPKKSKWLTLTGKNIGTKKSQSTSIPGTYCIIADYIETERKKSVFNKDDRKTCMKLCNFLDMAIDPHIDNFLTEKKTNKIVIIDTEHFPTLVGFKKNTKFSGYASWITHLSAKCAKAIFFRTKKDRKALQVSTSETELVYEKKNKSNLC